MLNHRFGIAIAIALAGLAYGCKTTNAPESKTVEAWDQRNGPDLFGAEAVTYDIISQDPYKQGQFAHVPWTDTYWPLYQAGFAARWINPAEAAPFELEADVESANYEAEVRNEINAALAGVRQTASGDWQQTIGVSPAEKYDIGVGDANFSLTLNELNNFARNRKAYKDISWGWMGHCHGWAPASYLFDTPQRGVLVKNSSTGKQVLFTPGDVRGLLTKAAADNQFSSRTNFMGTRCNDASANIPRDELGRIIDGALGTWSGGEFSQHVPVRVILNNWFNYNELNQRGIEIVFKVGPDFDNAKPFWLVARRWKDQRNKVVDVDVYTTRIGRSGRISKDMVVVSSDPSMIGRRLNQFGRLSRDRDETTARQIWRDAVAGTGIENARAEDFVSFKYYKECRDLNAGSFHTVLARYLAEGSTNETKRSFVMDITRDDQVWNHAIHNYQSIVGEPTPLSIQVEGQEEPLEDPFKTWRAPGTDKIVDVYTVVEFAVENGPKIIYAAEDEATNRKVLHYTLELDAAGKVIGGEWHGISPTEQLDVKSGADLLNDLARTIGEDVIQKPDSPDFIWGYEVGTFVTDGNIIKADFVKKVHACSINTEAPAQSIEVRGKTFEYVECDY